MGELERIVLTSAFTILGGLTVLVLGQIVIKFLVEPLHEQRKLIGETVDSLIFYANVYSNPGLSKEEAMDEASEDLRRKASLLRARTYAIPGYAVLALCRLTRPQSAIEDAARNMIFVSNSVRKGDGAKNWEAAESIRKSLGFPRHH